MLPQVLENLILQMAAEMEHSERYQRVLGELQFYTQDPTARYFVFPLVLEILCRDHRTLLKRTHNKRR